MSATPTKSSAKITQTRKRKRKRKAIKQNDRVAPPCVRLVVNAGKLCNFVGTALAAPFTSILRVNALEQQVLKLQDQVQALQRAEKKRRGNRVKTKKSSQLSNQDSASAQTDSVENVPPPPPITPPPVPPPMDINIPFSDDGPPPAPPLTPESKGPKVHQTPKMPLKIQIEDHSSRPQGITLTDITNVKLRKPSTQGSQSHGGGITKEDILKVKLRKGPALERNKDAKEEKSKSSGGLNLDEIKNFKLRKAQHKPSDEKPRKVVSAEERKKETLNDGLREEGGGITLHAFAALRQKFLSSPRGVDAIRKSHELTHTEKENLMTPANTHPCWTPAPSFNIQEKTPQPPSTHSHLIQTKTPQVLSSAHSLLLPTKTPQPSSTHSHLISGSNFVSTKPIAVATRLPLASQTLRVPGTLFKKHFNETLATPSPSFP